MSLALGPILSAGSRLALFSLWFYLIFKEAGRPRLLDGFVQSRYGLSDEALVELERFGEDLAERKRVVWHRSTVAWRHF